MMEEGYRQSSNMGGHLKNMRERTKPTFAMNRFIARRHGCGNRLQEDSMRWRDDNGIRHGMRFARSFHAGRAGFEMSVGFKPDSGRLAENWRFWRVLDMCAPKG
jgi:hypothetical protein